ncbi:hypothetical protein LVJ94_25845 [Pendulispora rubella]|uniref:Uncharacterized protein n=1 Tax=Pendulispora rubella TaxID=2741070 RepID=A0ABZ2LIS3_9BACT
MLSQIAEEIAGLSVSDVIGPVECDELDIQEGQRNAVYKRVAQGGIGIESRSAGETKHVRLMASTPLVERAVEYEVPKEFANACLWISRRRLSERFGFDDICRLGLSEKDAEELLATVAAAGIIERVEG